MSKWKDIYNGIKNQLTNDTTLQSWVSSNWDKHIFEGLEDRFIQGRNRGRLPYIEIDFANPTAIIQTNESDLSDIDIIVRCRFSDNVYHNNRADLIDKVKEVVRTIRDYSNDNLLKMDIDVSEFQRDLLSVFVDITVSCSLILKSGVEE